MPCAATSKRSRDWASTEWLHATKNLFSAPVQLLRPAVAESSSRQQKICGSTAGLETISTVAQLPTSANINYYYARVMSPIICHPCTDSASSDYAIRVSLPAAKTTRTVQSITVLASRRIARVRAVETAGRLAKGEAGSLGFDLLRDRHSRSWDSG